MSYADLEVACGPMFSGKTTESLKRALIARSLQNLNVIVFKPSFDDRYSIVDIVSHDGLKTQARSVTNVHEVRSCYAKDLHLVIFDEIQFFEPPYFEGDMVALVKEFLENGVHVFCAGLDMDWRGDPFKVTGQMLAMADKVTKLRANCHKSGLPASKTYKISQGGGSVELGAKDKYEARNNKYWSYK